MHKHRTAALPTAALPTAALLTAALLAAFGCRATPSGRASLASASSPASVALRTGQAPSSEWRSLVTGNSLAAWKGYKTDTVPSGWRAENGILMKDKPVGDIVTRDELGDFELSLEWRISSGGNAGIFYRGTEEYPRVYWTAPEYQLLDDDKAPDGASRLTSAGSAYGLYPSPAGHLKPVGEWNETRIIAKGAHVEHWLNGTKLLEYELWSADWVAKVKATKFSAWPNYGMAKRGRLALQGDHDGSLAFRNMKIRELR